MKYDFSDVELTSEAERLGRLYPIILENHNPEWKTWYEKEKKILMSIFGDAILRISHIGSTAVPGLIAKPTVDILLEIKENTDLQSITEELTESGYIVNRPPNDLIMFIKGYGEFGFEKEVYHIHVRSLGDYSELYFRDYLCEYPEIVKEYGELKRTLKEKYGYNRDAYTAAKGDFIGRITALARQKYEGRYIYNDK